MHALSLGPHRGADWLGRSAIGGRERGVTTERYVVRLWDPKHARAVWLCLGLQSEGQASCHVETFSPVADENRSAQETWPLERTTLDPERAGIGIGECDVQGQSTHGLVRGGDFSVAWRCTFAGGTAPVSLVKRESLYRPRRLSHKAAMMTVGASVSAGELEIWHETGRAARVSRISLVGWRVSVHHVWGQGAFVRYALLDAFSARAEAATVSATTYETTWLGLRRLQPQQGVLARGGHPIAFCGRKSLWSRHEGPQGDEGRWPLSLAAPAADFGGTVHVPAGPHRQVTIGGERLLVSAQAHLKGDITSPGAAAEPLHTERAMLEWSA